MENTKLLEKILTYLIDNVVTKSDLARVETRLVTLINSEVEGLATSTAKGFAATATKDEVREVKDELRDVEAHLSEISQKISDASGRTKQVEDDVRRVKTVLKMA